MGPGFLNENIAYLTGRVTHMFYLQVSRLFKLRGYSVKTTITRAIHNMEKDNLLVRIPSDKDKRVNLIYLTHKGKTLQDELVKSSGEIYLRAIQGITNSNLKATCKVLNKIIENLE
jgi:DNA-binding MarR family transcriptional regulator